MVSTPWQDAHTGRDPGRDPGQGEWLRDFITMTSQCTNGTCGHTSPILVQIYPPVSSDVELKMKTA